MLPSPEEVVDEIEAKRREKQVRERHGSLLARSRLQENLTAFYHILTKSEPLKSCLCQKLNQKVRKRKNPQEMADELRSTFPKVSQVTIDSFSGETAVVKTASWLGTLPLRLAAAPALDGFGAGAWDNILRRTSVLFNSDDELDVETMRKTDERPRKDPGFRRGAVALFMDKLVAEVAKSQEGKLPGEKNEEWEFVLVGHSMGAIIVNEIVRYYGEKLPISHIVYMAAACSIRDYEDSVWPYLRLREPKSRNLCAPFDAASLG